MGANETFDSTQVRFDFYLKLSGSFVTLDQLIGMRFILKTVINTPMWLRREPCRTSKYIMIGIRRRQNYSYCITLGFFFFFGSNHIFFDF